jgi:hypothetical protein|eukprot:SAG25_NODE_84_length_16553_cov_5.346238_20_plen_99_part_00
MKRPWDLPAPALTRTTIMWPAAAQSNRDHSATERRVLALERQLRAGTSEAVEQVQGKLLETTRQMEQKLSRVQVMYGLGHFSWQTQYVCVHSFRMLWM